MTLCCLWKHTVYSSAPQMGLILLPTQEGGICNVWTHLWLSNGVVMLRVYSEKKSGTQIISHDV